VKLVVGYLYPTIMSQYGDRGNVICLQQRCRWRGIDVEVAELGLGVPVDPDAVDILLMGGGADSQQRAIADDLVSVKGGGLRDAVEAGAAALMICGGYQLFGHSYRTYDGTTLKGLGIFDCHSVHRAHQLGARLDNVSQAGAVRAVNNLVIEWANGTLVGFENHGGRTYLAERAEPLGRVVVGGGNNSEDGWEGCVYQHAIGTYLHGSVLPKNPHLADYLIASALERRTGSRELEPLDDRLEWEAHALAVDKALHGGRKGSGRGKPAATGRTLVVSARRLIARTASRV
jgi:CobQ-like glutamine amidotransferase family enzyme